MLRRYFILLPVFALLSPARAQNVPPTETSTFLTGKTIPSDPLFFVHADGEPAPKALLLQIPEALPVIRSATLEITYEAGKDFEWKPGTREITLPAGSRIPFKTAEALHPAPNTPNSYKEFRGGSSWMLYGEGRYFHDLQCVASYPTAAAWQGPVTAPAPADQLETLRQKLRAGNPVKLVTLGDSISTGANASASAGAPPMQHGYHELVADGLEQRFGVKVGRKNLSVGGMDSAWGLTQIPAVLAETPDVVLLAFGMNDASGRRTTEEFSRITLEITDRLQTARPGCAVILISPMTANPEWSYAAPEIYPAYAAALKKLTGPGRAMADVTEIWSAVLTQKSYLSLSGNGLNHPNDFGHRLYAETVLAVIGGT